jgi:genome maintenance exonuclease 1
VPIEVKLPDFQVDTTPTGRFYTHPSGSVYPSVTTVLSVIEKPELKAWEERVGKEEAEKIRGQAATRGSEVHLIAENYINNKDYKTGTMPINLMTFQSIKPILDTRLDNIYAQETVLWSDKLKTAGRCDLIADFDSKPAIIDFKTSKRPKSRSDITSYFMQESFYWACATELFRMNIKQIVTIIAVDDSKPQIFIENPLEWLPNFISIRNQYKRIKGI